MYMKTSLYVFFLETFIFLRLNAYITPILQREKYRKWEGRKESRGKVRKD